LVYTCHAKRKKSISPVSVLKEDKGLYNTYARFSTTFNNHGVVIIGGDFNFNVHEYPCFSSSDEILVPSQIATAKRGCIDNIVVAKLECQYAMTVTVTRRDVINILDHPILDHNPALGVFRVKDAMCFNSAHAMGDESDGDDSRGPTDGDDADEDDADKDDADEDDADEDDADEDDADEDDEDDG
jgi:hypothetical protein